MAAPIEWLRSEIAKEPYWFHRIELAPGLVTPGWQDPKVEKLPYFGLPDEMGGLRVLDIGCSEGFFSFEAERRGAAEVVAIDSSPDAIRRFGICRAALDFRTTGYLTNVYDLNPRSFGTFDFIMFFGVLYHLRHPLLALEKIHAVCTGTLLLQSFSFEDPAVGDAATAKFHPFGIKSGPPDAPRYDPTVFWVPNAACVRDMMLHVGFRDPEHLTPGPGAIFRALAAQQSKGTAPDQMKAPWS